MNPRWLIVYGLAAAVIVAQLVTWVRDDGWLSVPLHLLAVGLVTALGFAILGWVQRGDKNQHK